MFGTRKTKDTEISLKNACNALQMANLDVKQIVILSLDSSPTTARLDRESENNQCSGFHVDSGSKSGLKPSLQSSPEV